MKKKGGRPRGSGGKYKKKHTLTFQEEQSLIKDYSLMTNSRLCKKYDISKGQLRTIKQRRGLKSKNLCKYTGKRLELSELKDKCGIYALVRIDSIKGYIGSSINIYKRILSHINLLNNNTHYNQELQQDWLSHEFYYCLVEEVNEKDLLTVENNLIMELDDFCLYNKLYIDKGRDYDYSELWKYMEPKIKKIDNGCWEWNGNKNSKGYGTFIRNKKHLLTHRISYIYHNDDFPILVGHLCNNKICCNPNHLKNKSVRENILYKTIAQNEEDRLKNSKLFKFRSELEEYMDSNLTYKQIANLLPIDVSSTTVYSFIKKLKKIQKGSV